MGATRCTTGENDAIISVVEPGTRRSCAPAPPESATATIKAAIPASGCRIRIMLSKSPVNGRDISVLPGQLKAGSGSRGVGDRASDESYALGEREAAVQIEFSNKRVIVAGAARGIGRAIVSAFAERGATVWAGDLLAEEIA